MAGRMSTSDGSTPLLRLDGVWKRFGGEVALGGADLAVAPGEIHGLLGANGSGKSTLIKVLAGFHDVDSGTLEVHGRPVPLPLSPGQPAALGLRFVHQDLGLVPSLSVLENYLLPQLAASRGRASVGWRRARTRLREVLARYELDLDPRATVADLRPVDRALLAIVRALEGVGTTSDPGRGQLVVLDEPTVFLPRNEVDRLFSLVRRVASTGSSVVFVSHDLDEVREITDRVTVLRNGRRALTGVTADLGHDQLVAAIVGADLDVAASYRAAERSAGTTALRVEGLSAGLADQVSFTAGTGEVVGFTGLLGSGYEDAVRALAGALDVRAGTVTLDDGPARELRSWSPRAATDHGIVLVPGDRLTEGIVGDLPVTDNLTMVNLRHYLAGPWLDRRAMRAAATTLVERYDVRPPDPRLLVGQLSGGNQQKVVLAKWIQTRPRVLLLHEPTQGVDIGARQQIYAAVRAAAGGCVVLCASSDHDQLAQLCDRVLILHRGRIGAELHGSALTKARITEECLRSGKEGSTR